MNSKELENRLREYILSWHPDAIHKYDEQFIKGIKKLLIELIGKYEKELDYYDCGSCFDADYCHFEKETCIKLNKMIGRNELREELRQIVRGEK
jgi:hypothetical protein